MAGNSTEAGRTVASRIAAILAVFTAAPTHSLSDVATQSNLPFSTAHRLLRDLVTSGLLERTESGGYRPGIGVRSLLHEAMAPALEDRGPLIVDDLSAALGRPVRLGILDELEVAYIEKRPGPFPGTSFPTKARLPIHASALGKALLAHAPRALVQMVLAYDLPCYTRRTITVSDALRRCLDVTRAKGFAVTDRELDTVTAVAVPVIDGKGLTIAALEAQVPRLCRRTVADVLPALRTAARRLGREVDAGERMTAPTPLLRDLPTAL